MEFLTNLIDEEYKMLMGETICSLKDCKIDTVDAFQGSEMEIIILSTVRSNDEGNVGFAPCRNRVNVAITRARSMLLILGNKKTLEYDPIWSDYLTHIGSLALISKIVTCHGRMFQL